MAHRLSLQNFLRTAKTALSAPKAPSPSSSPLTFVIGNESADLDSLCSAIVLAYLRTHASPHTLHIPLSNLPRDDLSLRPEMTAVLGYAGLETSDVLTLSELPDLDPKDTQWLLVDHNAPTGFLKEKYGDQVIGCIDHHAEERVVAVEAATRVVEPCGSCMSLIVEDTKDAWRALADQQADSAGAVSEVQRLAKLALAPILIDTANLTSGDKVQPKDTQSVNFLESLLSDTAFDRTKFFDDITAFKIDISQLSLRDVYRKDYKEWHDNGLKLGVSSVVKSIGYLTSNHARGVDEMLSEFEHWSAERTLDVASIMTTSYDDKGEFQRELLVWGISERGAQALERFEQDAAADLQLKTWKNGAVDAKGRKAWVQGKLSASRKQVAPLLRDAMKKT